MSVTRIFGNALPSAGSIHIAAVWRSPESRLHVLRINEATPKSTADYLLLNTVRAWADVVLTTGEILRSEPDLCFDLDASSAAELRTLHAVRGGRGEPVVAILSSGRGLAMPLRSWRSAARPVVYTSPEGERLLRTELGESLPGLEIKTSSRPTPRSMTRWAKRSFSRVAIELGPSTSASLYDASALVDRLSLSVFGGSGPTSETFAERVIGPQFLPGLDVERFERVGPIHREQDWSFRCLRIGTD